MTITDATYFSVAFDFVLQVATIVFLAWLYRYTRVKPVLYNMIWRTLAIAWGPISRMLNVRTFVMGHGNVPTLNVYVFAASEIVSVTGTLFFVWMLFALAQWGRASVLGRKIPPIAAA